MRVSNITVARESAHCVLGADISDCGLAEPFHLWFRFPGELGSSVDPHTGDAFVAAVLLVAMRRGDTLDIDASVSLRLLRAIETIQAIYCSWDPGLHKIRVQPRSIRRRRRWRWRWRAGRVGLFFSLGVDSTYSLFMDVRRKPRPTVTDLIVVNGFDLPGPSGAAGLFDVVLANASRVAWETHTRVVPVTTNLRDLVDQFAEWGKFADGAAMASVALALGRQFRAVSIASGQSYDSIFPAGTHPLLDPLWSTEDLTVIHDGCEANRSAKVRFIAQFPVVLQTLRVCWQNTDGAYNCGCCNKCLGTMIRLQMAGVLSAARTFPHSIDLDLVRGMSVMAVGQQLNTEALMRDLGDSDDNLPLKDALEACLAGYAPAVEEQASRDAAHIRGLQKWIGQLEEAKAWLEEQRGAWQRTAERQALVIAELQTRLDRPPTNGETHEPAPGTPAESDNRHPNGSGPRHQTELVASSEPRA